MLMKLSQVERLLGMQGVASSNLAISSIFPALRGHQIGSCTADSSVELRGGAPSLSRTKHRGGVLAFQAGLGGFNSRRPLHSSSACEVTGILSGST